MHTVLLAISVLAVQVVTIYKIIGSATLAAEMGRSLLRLKDATMVILTIGTGVLLFAKYKQTSTAPIQISVNWRVF